MKQEKINKYKKDPRVMAFLAAFIGGLLIHLFALVNVLHNQDDICVQPYGYGAGVESGRWFLAICGNFVGNVLTNYNLPWTYGFIFIAFLAASAFVVTDIFSIRSRKLAALTGLVFVSFPSVTSAMMFRFTVPYYGLAILLSTLAAYVLIKAKRKYILWGLLSALLTALSLGIYQAYVTLTVAILVLYLIQQALLNEKPWYHQIYRGIYYCVCLALGLVAYLLFLKLSLWYFDTELSGYRGMDSALAGGLSLATLPATIWRAFVTFCTMPIRNHFTLAPIRLITVCYFIIGALAGIMLLINLIQRKAKAGQIVITILLCMVYPIAINLTVFMAPLSEIYALMVHAFSMVLVTPMVLFEALPKCEGKGIKLKKVLSSAMVIVLTVMVFGYSYIDNVNYTAAYYANRQTENYFNSLVTQIRMTEGFEATMKWAFIGRPNDPHLRSKWNNAPHYGGVKTATELTNSYSWHHWIRNHTGYGFVFADEKTMQELMQKEEVKAMTCYPDYGSIRIVDGVVVVKFEEK